MWRVLAACCLAVSLAGADQHERDHKTLILLEVEPTIRGKRSPQHGASQAVFGASPGQFSVRTASASADTQPDVPAEYLSLLQQLQDGAQILSQPVLQQLQDGAQIPSQPVLQQLQDGAQIPSQPVLQQLQDGAQIPSQPVLQQLLISRNPDQSAVQFSSTPGLPPPRRRPPPSPQAQLQQLYFNQQFQQQIPVRPRTLRPPPRPAAVTTASQAHGVHEARLRASLAGSDPDLAVQALNQQQSYLTDSYDQQLTGAAQAQPLPQQFAQVQSLPQEQTAYTISPQLSESPVTYSSRQSARPQQLLTSERVKPPRRPAAAEQYIRETTQPLSDQRLVQLPRGQENSKPTIYLSSQSGLQSPSNGQDDEIVSQLLSQQGGDLFPSSTPSPATLSQVIKSSNSLPSTESRSSIFVTQTSTVRSTQSPGRVTIHEVGPIREDSSSPLPVVHLPTPEGQRPLTQNELQALIDAGFKISPAPESPQTEAPVYYQQTTKRQRSYVTTAPPYRNLVTYQSRQNKPQQEKNDDQQLASQRGQVSNYEPQDTKPRPEDEVTVQYVQRPEGRKIPATGIQILTNNPETEEEIIHFIHIPRASQTADLQQRSVVTKYQGNGPAQTEGLEDEGTRTRQHVQATRYDPSAQEVSYHTEQDSLPQQTPSYQQGDKSTAQHTARFHPIVVAELPATTEAPSPTPRRRRPRPGQNRAVYRDQTGNGESQAQYLVSYDSIPAATSFGTRNSRLKARHQTSDEKS